MTGSNAHTDHDGQFFDWAARLRWDDLPDDVVRMATDLVADYLGCLLGGLATETSRICRRLLPTDPHGVHVAGLDGRWAVPDAARTMAIAGHTLEMDDVVASASLHPGTVVIPAALAVGESVGASGSDLLAAVVVGYELMVRLGEAVDPARHYADGFHPTATCGTFAAAITAARLLGADATQIRHALGFAGTGVGGTLSYLNDGAGTKPVQVGNATSYGVAAALSNHAGLLGPGTVLEGRYGFYQAYAPHADPARLVKGLGNDPLRIMDTSFKPFACCRYVQPGAALLLDLVSEGEVAADDVDRVRVGVVTPAIGIIGEPRERKVSPSSVVDTQFSLPFCAAITLRRASLLPGDIADSIGDPATAALATRVELVADAELDEAYPDKWGAWVEVTTSDGRRIERSVRDAKGDPGNPMTAEERLAKLEGLAGPDGAAAVSSAVGLLPERGVAEVVAGLARRTT